MSTKDQWQGPMRGGPMTDDVTAADLLGIRGASIASAGRRCEGHRDHRFEPRDCLVCGHTLDEHPDGRWEDDRG